MSADNNQKKAKLKTASEVLSRLRWSSSDDFATIDNTLVGYDCRIHGPLEKCAADFASVAQGGEIPEHRIQYFRIKSIPLSEGIYWDRKARLDRLFDSGDGQDTPISAVTLKNAAEAIVNMQRLAEERAIRVQEKAKMRARNQAKKAAARKKLMQTSNKNSTLVNENGGDKKCSRIVRHVWEEVENYHVYDGATSAWKLEPLPKLGKGKSEGRKKSFKVITWNVLFDLSRDENNDFVQIDNSLLADTDSTLDRWKNILEILRTEDACIVALQEVTARFVEQLEALDWVKEKYALSSGLNDLGCLEPYGNITMWKKDSFTPSSLSVCKDLNRCRSMIVSLQSKNQIINVANIHLPADSHNKVTRETIDRTTARQRELSAIIAKVQILEGFQKNLGIATIPLILGDFNSDSEMISKEYFLDSWILSGVGNPGLTYNWRVNRRAEKLRATGFSKKEPRRIDRIYVGRSSTKSIGAKLIGDSTNSYEFPPSDHYGVSVTFKNEEENGNCTALYDPSKVECNAWSKSAIPSTEFLLALICNDSTCNGTALYDDKSSLPLTHVTLLNGFVDFSSEERLKLTVQCLQDSVENIRPKSSTSQDWSLPIDKSSFRLFEHRNSATVVCCPDVESKCGGWLKRLYNTLRVKFTLCHEQESRFAGWTPHFSIGSFASISEARDHVTKLIEDNSWDGKRFSVDAYGLAMFQRDTEDGRFYLSQSIPFVQHSHIDTALFLNDAGASLSASMNGISSIVLKEVERACRQACCRVGQNRLQITVKPYGSYPIAASLPGISDIDGIAILQSCLPSDDTLLRSLDSNSFLNMVASRISYLYRNAKVRIRVSNKLYILTIKLAPQYPSLDLMVCRLDSNDEPIDDLSVEAMNTIKDSNSILTTIHSLQQSTALDIVQVISGALRIIKLWANNRKIYGTKFGFFGGGGWVILMLWLIESGDVDLSEVFHKSTATDIASCKLAKIFFLNILSKWSSADVVALKGSDVNTSGVIKDAIEVASNRRHIAVIAPHSDGNFGKSLTYSSYLTTVNEILRAKQLLEGKSSNFNSVLDVFTIHGLILALTIEIPSGNVQRPADIKAWGSTRTLHMVVSLEHKVGPDVVRPISNIMRKNGSFWFFIGVEESSTAIRSTLNEFIQKESLQIEEEGRAFVSDSKIQLFCLDVQEYEKMMT